MKEHSIKAVRLTPTVKARLDTFKGSDTVSVCIDRMITFLKSQGSIPATHPGIRRHWWKRELRTLSESSSPRNGIYSSPYLRNSPP